MSEFGSPDPDKPSDRANWGAEDGPQGDYEILRDTIVAAFNPPDEDSAEPAIMAYAIDRAWQFIHRQPCECGTAMEIDWYGEEAVCGRCLALGEELGKPVER